MLFRSALEELKKSPIATIAGLLTIASLIFAFFLRLPDLPVPDSAPAEQVNRVARGRVLIEICLIVPSLAIIGASVSLAMYHLFRAASFFGAILIFAFSVIFATVLSTPRILPLTTDATGEETRQLISFAAILISTITNLIFAMIVGGRIDRQMRHEHGPPTSSFIAGLTLFLGTNWGSYKSWWVSILLWIPVCGVGGIWLAGWTVKYLVGVSPTFFG